jgi:hypothetical protein
MPETPGTPDRARRAAGQLVDAVDRALLVLEQLKKARAKLSQEANRAPIRLALTETEADQEGGDDE